MARPGLVSPRIVPRRDEDWPSLLELWVASWRATYPDIDFDARRDWLRQQVLRLERSGSRTLLLREGAPPATIGFVVIDPATHWLDQLCVHPTRFGSGAAEALIEAARSISPARLRLDVNADNRRAVSFYEREGFVSRGEGAPSLSGRRTLIMEWTSALLPQS
ncbi:MULTISPECIES: GNAT family N-acetyltransferase [Methylosinus]|uniref:N-acetyltransferase n=1 Tax=Methylosinus trichosporium (strain ATCC 35070 / NCIMB 11131 / UNIQEM 75 / OB3b) TaxID=595536 RepID=A0A2D2CVD3_METT3|nr:MULTISPECIES: GNAT family N-acetyltransferase [Methylosinus]ATQ66655.1 N-acetyltransferase [Methylosinus trichosporium OB3b]OBS51736.1 GCN5 family acetyltransferase [Methylosinus sp. 3S-1]